MAAYPDDAKYRQTLIASYCNLAAALTGADAEVTLGRAIALGDELLAEYPAVPAYHSRLANAHNALGVILAERGEHEKAKDAFGRAIELRTRVATMLPNTDDNAVRLGSTYGNMADLVRESGEPVRALEWYARAVETLAPVARREPRLRDVRRHLSRSLVGRSRAYADLGRFADAIRDLDAVVESNPSAGDGNDADRAVVNRARLLLNLSWLEQTFVRHCGSALATVPDDRPYVGNYALPYVGTADSERSLYRDLEWIRAGPRADDPSRDEPSTHEAD